jgi:hypothetical protein
MVMTQQMRVGVLGAGGLGRGMAQLCAQRNDIRLVAMADSQAYAFDAQGLDPLAVADCSTLLDVAGAVPSADSIIDLLKAHGSQIDGLFMALPNLPVTFYAETVQMILNETGYKGVMVDALKRTKAVEAMLGLKDQIRDRGMVYITGCGATPGFLSTAAAVAAQSFVEVTEVKIWFGVGVACWEDYKATIREDFLHMPGFTADQVYAMTDADIEAELAKHNGLLELHHMEHADDLLLEMAGVCSRDRVTVGGLVDTKSPNKPVSTTVTITGRTMSGKTGSHTFTLSDATTMVDNVCGPALGFLRAGHLLQADAKSGLFASTQVMPVYTLASVSLPAVAV